MDERLMNNIDAVRQTNAPAQTPVKKKSSKAAVIILTIGTIILIGGVIATLFITGIIGGKKGNGDPEIPAETTFDDSDSIKTIENKLKSLLGAIKENDSYSVNLSEYDDISLITKRDLSEEEKVYRAFMSLNEANKKEIDELSRETAAEVWSREGGDPALFNAGSLKAFTGGAVAKQFKSLFGTELNRLSLESSRIQYVPEMDFYFTVNTPTPTNITRFYYFSEYLESENIVSVYVSSAQYNSETREVLCGVALPTAVEKPDLCATIPETDSFALTSENYGSYPLTRLDFIRTDEDGYVFIGEGSPLNPQNIVEEE